MHATLAIIFATLVGVSHASYLAGPAVPVAAPLPVPVAAAVPLGVSTTAHVGNVVTGVSRSFSNIPHTRFTRTDWEQPGSLITSPVHAPIIQPVFQNIAVPGPTHFSQHLIPNPPLVLNERHLAHGVAHVPTVAHVPAAVPVAAPVAVPVAAPLPVPVAAAPVAVKGY